MDEVKQNELQIFFLKQLAEIVDEIESNSRYGMSGEELITALHEDIHKRLAEAENARGKFTEEDRQVSNTTDGGNF